MSWHLDRQCCGRREGEEPAQQVPQRLTKIGELFRDARLAIHGFLSIINVTTVQPPAET